MRFFGAFMLVAVELVAISGCFFLLPPVFEVIYDKLTETDFVGSVAMAKGEIEMPKLVEFSSSLFQLTVAFLGGIWGVLVLEKGDKIQIRKNGFQLMKMVLASVLLVIACIHHMLYLNEMVVADYTSRAKGVVVDVTHQIYLEHLYGQELSLLFAAILVVCAVVQGLSLPQEPVTCETS